MVLPWCLLGLIAAIHIIYLFVMRPTFDQLYSSFKTGTLVVLFLVHMKVSTKMFEIMDCREVEGVDYLVADL